MHQYAMFIRRALSVWSSANLKSWNLELRKKKRLGSELPSRFRGSRLISGTRVIHSAATHRFFSGRSGHWLE